MAVVGRSGSGKTTLLNLMSGLDRPTHGKVVFQGRDLSTLSEPDLVELRRHKIAFVFQSFGLMPLLSAQENVELPLLYSDLSATERRRRALQVLDDLGLGDRRDHHPSQLSGGEQQRVATARAVVNQPLMILADEPTGSLESRTSLDIMALFQDLNRSGMTIVLVTHNADIARHAKRIINFRDGRMIDDSPIDSPVDAVVMLSRLPADEQAATGPSPGPIP